MSKFIDLTGQKFGRLTVLERAENDKCGGARWKCRCDCGRETVVAGNSLRSGHSKSCGCWKNENTSKRLLKDLTGQRFGKLLVLERAENAKDGKVQWKCKCDCGNTFATAGIYLTQGDTKSCGCWKNECAIVNLPNAYHHGMRNSKIYNIWSSIKARCFNTNDKRYADYGGRGITLYEPWCNDFQAFYDYVSTLEHFGKSGYSLDRIENDGNYEPGNLRWADRKTQNRNTRRNIIVKYNGEKMTLAEAAEKSKVPIGTLKQRLKRGITGEALFLLPT